MRDHNSSIVVTSFISLLTLTMACANKEDSESHREGVYASPTAVFLAYREARVKRDFRKVFSCLTPDQQAKIIFEAYFSCVEVDSDETRAIMKKYVSEDRFEEEYNERYKQKHGVDLAQLRKAHENDPKFTPPEPDQPLLRDALAANVKDKPGFFEAVYRRSPRKALPLGDLHDLVVRGETATGRAKMTMVPNVAGGETPLKPGQSPPSYETPFTFLRLNGGWLIDRR